MWKIEEILHAHPGTNMRLGWLPKTAPFVGFKRARQLAMEAIRTADADDVEELHTIRSQKAKTEEAAVAKWADRYYQAPRTSSAYQSLLTEPPDGKPHYATLARPPTRRESATLLSNATHPQAPPKLEAKFSRRTYTTFYRLITGHAFTGEYTRRFLPQHTPEQVACPCGEPVQTVEHVLLHCPLHETPRHKHITASGRPHTLAQILKNPTQVSGVLSFLEESGACAKPRAAWEPG